ncbi:lysine-specific permease [Bordetella trematum]|uniref:amino acid permease n=1 Tax=Bordetella trematum TaxID=123899 RepID=UPI000472FD1B|nr:amino acid permease [Bordetella trematum]AUL46160.1 gamma-aminobutyrate permease [Bordetella trematum]CZZ98745.1 lysine-specific permease [Bordetella trematum]
MSASHSPGPQPFEAEAPHLRRVLKPRHLTMIAIGGAIGTGLFVASGATIAQAGPGGALLTYLVLGLMVYFIMTSLGELAAFMPVPGSFATYAARYVDEGLGFALGWNFWFSWAVVVAVDLVAAQLVMAYWLPDVPGILWSGLFLLLMLGLNAFSARGFGESEYWFALIKVIAVVCFLITGVAMLSGIVHDVPSPGLSNWSVGEAPFVGNFATLVGVAMVVAYSFQGTELVGVAAGESENPRRNVPLAIKRVFWRILLFYVLSIAVIGLLLPYTDPQLLRSDVSDIAVSPFTLVFEKAGLLSAATVMNAVILTSVLSAGNSGMYAATRMLFNMAREGMAPRRFARLSRSGVPVHALAGTTALASLCLFSAIYSPQAVYIWLLNLAGMTEFIIWLSIAVSHYRFRKGYLLHGHDPAALPYRAGLFPFGPLLAFVLCLVITLGQNYEAFLQDRIDWGGALSTYLGIVLFLATWAGYRLMRRSRWIRYQDMRFDYQDEPRPGDDAARP